MYKIFIEWVKKELKIQKEEYILMVYKKDWSPIGFNYINSKLNKNSKRKNI
jgi:hypothetical protein